MVTELLKLLWLLSGICLYGANKRFSKAFDKVPYDNYVDKINVD